MSYVYMLRQILVSLASTDGLSMLLAVNKALNKEYIYGDGFGTFSSHLSTKSRIMYSWDAFVSAEPGDSLSFLFICLWSSITGIV
jgi:hypothetical protein